MASWYSAKLLFRSTVNGLIVAQPLCEESIRVLVAETDEAAQVRAAEVGRSAEHEYVNEHGELVRWSFVAVLDLQDLCVTELEDGMEVFSRLFRDASGGGEAGEPGDVGSGAGT